VCPHRGLKDWHRFFEICPDLFCIASYDGYFLRVNKNFTRVLGYSEFELISRPFLEMVHEEDRSRTIGTMGLLLDGLSITRFRNRYRTTVGDYVTLEWTARADQDERIIFAVARDVSADDTIEKPQMSQA
jgi:serine/threonine-protein kinase